MINDNRIIFGHGTVVVGSSEFPPAITFKQSDMVHPVGTQLEPCQVSSDKIISIPLNDRAYAELNIKLQQVEMRETTSVSFCGYILDFTLYNLTSIQVVRKNAQFAMSVNLIARAC